MKIVFAGTPDFAVPSLAALVKSRHKVALVVTQPDRPAGRHRHLTPPPVKMTALQNGIPVIQPESINLPDPMAAIQAIEPDALVVVAYGNILSRRTLKIPRLGNFNVHASLLPLYRGAAPIARSIQNCDRETGITIQRVVFEVDAGPILAQRAIAIGKKENSGQLSDRLAVIGGEMIVAALDAIEEGRSVEVPQDASRMTIAPKLTKNEGHIPWHLDADALDCFIRAMTPWPGAYAFFHDTRVVILDAESYVSETSSCAPGTVVRADAELVVAAGRGCIAIRSIKPEGGRAMDAGAFLRGHAVKPGDIFRGA